MNKALITSVIALPMIFLLSFLLVAADSSSANGPPSNKESKTGKQPAEATVPQTQAPSSTAEAKSQSPVNSTGEDEGLPQNLEVPVKIYVTFLVDEIAKVHEELGTFEGTVDIELQWHDPSAAFNPQTQSSFRKKLCGDKAVAALSKMWNPEIVIANMNQKPVKLEQCLFIMPDGTVTFLQRVKGIFETSYNLKAFPFDSQSLSIKLRSNRYNDSEVQFEQMQEQINRSGFREGVTFSGWNLDGIDYSISTSRSLDGTFYSTFEANSNISRMPLSDLLAFAPLLIIVFIPTFVTLYSDKDIGTRFSNWSGAILALIALNFTLNSRYPALASDSLLAGLIATIFFYEFVMIILSMTVLEKVKDKTLKNHNLLQEITEFLQWGIPVGLLILISVQILLTKYSG